MSQQQTLSAAGSFPTPASSVSGHIPGISSTDDTENGDNSFGAKPAASAAANIAPSTAPTIGEQEVQQQGDYGRTDHNRQSGEPSSEDAKLQEVAKSQDGSEAHGKDVDAMDVDGDHNGVSSSVNDGRLNLDSLQENFTSAFHLCKSFKVSLNKKKKKKKLPLAVAAVAAWISRPRSLNIYCVS